MARFLILTSPLDPNPTVVERKGFTHFGSRTLTGLVEVLGDETRVEEIFWNFSRLQGKQRITLQQNPYFYKGLPRSARSYTDDFTAEPIENFRDATEILVLTDKQSRVYLKTKETRRVFGNVWGVDEAIIFKGQSVVCRSSLLMPLLDIHGKLQGDRIVEAAIQGTPNVWTRAESESLVTPPVERLQRSQDSGPADPSWNRIFQDWRQSVRDSLDSPNVNVYIDTWNAPPESPVDWVSSRTPPPHFITDSSTASRATRA